MSVPFPLGRRPRRPAPLSSACAFRPIATAAPAVPPDPRILFVSPYAAWHVHTAQEAVLAHALRLRGAEVRFALCDGLLPACDIYRANLNPRQPSSCRECQLRVAHTAAELKLPFEWLSTRLPPRAREAV